MYTESEEGVLRYCLEHKYLKDEFFSNPLKAITKFNFPDAIFMLYRDQYIASGLEFHYTKEQFNVSIHNEDTTTYLIIELPEPDYASLCYRIYMAYDYMSQKKYMFTLEKSLNLPCLCYFDEDKHSVVERFNADKDEELLTVKKKFKELQ